MMMQRRPPSGAQAVDKGSLAYLQSRNKNRRMNLLFVLGLTVVNIALLFADSSSYFLFSALLPYWTVAFGYYWEVPVLMAVGIGILLVYLVLFLLWDRHPAVPIAALVLFSLDCAFLVWLCIGERSPIISWISCFMWPCWFISLTACGLPLRCGGNRRRRERKFIRDRSCNRELRPADMPPPLRLCRGGGGAF